MNLRINSRSQFACCNADNFINAKLVVKYTVDPKRSDHINTSKLNKKVNLYSHIELSKS